MRSQTFKLGLVGLALMAWMAGLAVAGPLDRSSDGPRNNPAVDDMMRIPGVLNMDYEEAMGLLQEAGLNPRVKAIKRVPDYFFRHKRARRREGNQNFLATQPTCALRINGNLFGKQPSFANRQPSKLFPIDLDGQDHLSAIHHLRGRVGGQKKVARHLRRTQPDSPPVG